MRVIDLDQIDDEEERKKVLESYQNKIKDMQNERSSYLQQTGLDKIFSGDYSNSNSNDGFNTAGRNDFAVQAPLWDQIKTTASNMLGNVGYGLGNGLIGFTQNERRNQTVGKSLDLFNKINVSSPMSILNNTFSRLGKSIDSTLDYALKDNTNYNNFKKTKENIENNILSKIDEKLQKQEDINNENIQKNIQETTNPIGQKLVEISPSLGQMIPSAIPGIGTLYSVGSATDSYYDEAKARGMNDEQASNYSQIMGVAEGLTEQIGVGKLVKGGKGIAKGTIKEAFKDFGIGVADNFIQEAVIEPISEGVTKATAGDEHLKNDYRTSEGWKNLGKDMLQSGLDGAITAGIMSGVSAGLGKSVNIYNKLRNNQQVTNNEVKGALDEARENGIDIDGIVQDEFKSRINQTIQSNNKNIDTSKMNLVDSAKAYNLNSNDETIQSINQKLNDRGISSRFDENLFKDSNGKVRTDVNALWRNTIDEKGNTQREVIFNPKADTNKTLQQVSIHEMLHDMTGTKEYEDLSKLILDKNSNREGYSNSRSNLEEMYSQVYDRNSKEFKSLVDEEEVADTLAQKLGDQDFINSLNKEKPNVFKRIYDWVVDKLNKFTGSKNEKIYWEDVKNKFESAYKQDYQGTSNSNRFSIQTDSNGNKFVKIDTNQDIFKGKTLSEQTKIAKQYILDNFRDKGLKLDNENVNVTSKTANEYTHPKNQLPYKTKQAKIKASTELDNMLNISDYQYSSNDDGRHRFAKDGWDYYKTVFEVDGVKFEGLVNIAKSGNKKTFYDVTNIKRISQNRSASDQSFSTSLTNSTNSIPTSNNNVNTTNNNNSMQESENNSGSFNLAQNNTLNVSTKKLTENQRQNRLEYLKNVDISNMKLLEKSKIKSEIRALENGYNSVEEMRKVEKEQEQKAIQEYYKKSNTIKDSNKSSFKSTTNSSFKEQQLGIIQKTNPMLDDYHTGIRTVDDIKTFKEAYDIAKKEAKDGGWTEYASYPDITNEMIEDSLKTGEITVYSSNDIKNGTFVTPSYEQALDYAGGNENNIKSKKVKVDDVAWINLDEGQYAKVDTTKTSIEQSEGAWQSFLENQIGPTGKGKTVQELRLPTRENLNSIKQQKIINQNNKKRLKDIGITENSDLVTNGNNDNISEDKIANILTEMPTKEKEKSRALAILKANILDKGIVFEELSRKTKNRELQGKWDYTLTASARGQNAIGRPRYEFDSRTKTQKLISKSLESIREEVGKNVVDFNEYMYHQLNIDRMTLEERFGGDTGINYERKNKIENKPVFGKIVTAKVSQEIVNKYEKNNPEFKKWAKDVYDFLDANTQELVKTGVISEDTRQLFKEMYPHYVPISRVDNKGNAIAVPLDTRRTGVNSPIKKAKGGNSDIKPLFETIADRTLQTYRASARNNFGVELLNTLQTVQNAERIDVDNIVEEITNSEDGNLLKKGKGTEPPSFTVFVNGEKVTFEISKDMYDALKPISEGLSYRNKALNKISNFRRGVLTEYNPVFMITNSLKDIQDVVVNSQHTAKTISKLPEAYSQIIDKGYWYNEYIQNGGEQNSYFNANDGSFENDKKVNMAKNIATIPLNAISKVNNIIEMSPRLAEYIASREKGRSIETSMLDASRVTTNFKAGGNVTKFLNRNGATFLNASVQGAMQQVRNIQEAKVKGLKGWTALACKYAVAGLPAIMLNNILWKDDEDYENLQDYVKDSYYCIAKYGDGKFIRIPKGRTTATIQKIISNASEYITDDKKLNIDNLAKDFWEDLQFTMDNLAPNNPLDNNIISPIIQAVTNTSWYGEDIVPSRLQDKPASEQYDESTDKFSKWLGEKLKISPYKINYLLDQYGGGISDIVLPMLTPQAENNMMEDKFTTDSVMKSRYPGDFFEKSDEIKVNANSDKATDLDKVKNKYMTNISKEMSKLYEEKRKIENSNVSDDIKKDQLKEVQKEINKIAKVGIEESDKVKVDGNTAKAGDELYYKYHGEWTKLDEDEKEKTKNISLKSYADFKNKIYNETQRQKDSGELEENKQLKNTTKSKILLDSSYSDKDKLELYKNYISSTDKKVSVTVEKLGMPIDVYLDYKSNKFENDKDDDGETISGTKKDKVYNYVNSLNDVDLIYKYMMVKMSDINDSYADKAILNFVDNNKAIDFEERNEILETLGFDVDKNGNVQNLIFIPIKSRIK